MSANCSGRSCSASASMRTVASPAVIVVGEVVELSDAEDRLARYARTAEGMTA